MTTTTEPTPLPETTLYVPWTIVFKPELAGAQPCDTTQLVDSKAKPTNLSN